MHLDAMNGTESNEAETRRLFACLGDPSRFRLVGELAAGGKCVGELARRVGLSQSCTTRHLQTLQRAGLVERCREGRRVRFTLRSETPGLKELIEWALLPRATAVPSAPASDGGSTGAARRAQAETAARPDPAGGTEERAPKEQPVSRRLTGDLDDYLL